MSTLEKGIFCHILPQVLLRGFRIDKENFSEKDTENKNLAKISVLHLSDFSIEEKLINDFGGEYDFYQKEIESMLDKNYEQPFGLIKQNILKLKRDRTILIDVDDFRKLIIFNAILWRRNEFHVENVPLLIDSIANKKNLNDLIYNEFFLRINNKSQVYLKTVHCYETFIIYNESEINFPLHNKHATVNKKPSLKNNLPEKYIFEPLTSKVMVLHVRKEKDLRLVIKKINDGIEPEKFKDKRINIKSIIIKDEKFIRTLIMSYIMIQATDSLKYYVCDASNVEIIKNCYFNKEHFEQWRDDFNNTFYKYYLMK